MINLPKPKTQQGFTLIELLVVVLVISALSGVVISMINSGGFRDKAKDAQRVADLKLIQTALELHFSDLRYYPNDPGNTAWTQVGWGGYLTSALVPAYTNSLPVDPDGETGGNNGPCYGPSFNRYNYSSPTGEYYMLTAMMAVISSNEGNECDLASICSGGYNAEDYCYFVESP